MPIPFDLPLKSGSITIDPYTIDKDDEDDLLEDYEDDDWDDPLEDYKFDLWHEKQVMEEEKAQERENVE